MHLHGAGSQHIPPHSGSGLLIILLPCHSLQLSIKWTAKHPRFPSRWRTINKAESHCGDTLIFRCVELVAPNVSVFFLQPAASASETLQNWLTSLRETDLFTVPCGLSSLRLCRHENKVRFGLMSSSSGFRGFAKSTKQLRLDTAQIETRGWLVSDVFLRVVERYLSLAIFTLSFICASFPVLERAFRASANKCFVTAWCLILIFSDFSFKAVVDLT